MIKKLILALMLGVGFALNTTDDQIRGISWFGFETEHRALMCDWSGLGTKWYLDKLQSLGFNSIRLPFSMDYIHANDFTKIDEFFHAIDATDLTVILDFHRLRDSHQSAKPWIDGETTLDDFLQAWDTIIKRYESNPRIIGLDIFNEFQSTNAPEWSNIARQIISYLDQRYGHHGWLYFVQGVSWGGNTHDLNFDDMACADRIRYTAHKYAFTTTEPYEHDWEWSISNHQPSRINIGEFGFISDRPTEKAWAIRFMGWLKEKGIRSSYFWCVSPNSFDTGGLFLDDCKTVDCSKVRLLRHYWYDT